MACITVRSADGCPQRGHHLIHYVVSDGHDVTGPTCHGSGIGGGTNRSWNTRCAPRCVGAMLNGW